MRALVCGVLLLCLSIGGACAQDKNAYSRENTFSLFIEGSKPSTPIFLGSSQDRLLFSLGGGYARRVFRFQDSSLSYQVEVRPAIFESDPVAITTYTMTSLIDPDAGVAVTQQGSPYAVNTCQPGTYGGSYPTTSPTYTYTVTTACGRQWTYGQVFSPLGYKYSLRINHAVQPYVIGTLGYMYTSRPVPVAQAEAFNFSFDTGLGLEVFRGTGTKKSLTAECRYHHFSNRDTAEANPGTDNLMFKLTYNFGR